MSRFVNVLISCMFSFQIEWVQDEQKKRSLHQRWQKRTVKLTSPQGMGTCHMRHWLLALRGMSREGSTWAFFLKIWIIFFKRFLSSVFLHVDNFLQIYVYLSVVKLEVHPSALDAMFLSALFVLFERRESHNHVNPDREGLALQRFASDNLPRDCNNRIPCVWNRNPKLDDLLSDRKACEKHNRRSIWDDLDPYAFRLCMVTDIIIRSKRSQGYIQIPTEHETVQITRSTGRFLRRENLLRWEHEFR